MGAWYWIGVATGLGVAAGIVIGAVLPQGPVSYTHLTLPTTERV